MTFRRMRIICYIIHLDRLYIDHPKPSPQIARATPPVATPKTNARDDSVEVKTPEPLTSKHALEFSSTPPIKDCNSIVLSVLIFKSNYKSFI